MLSNHEKELVEELADFNTLTLVAVMYSLYEQICTKDPISRKDFLEKYVANFNEFSMLFEQEK